LTLAKTRLINRAALCTTLILPTLIYVHDAHFITSRKS